MKIVLIKINEKEENILEDVDKVNIFFYFFNYIKLRNILKLLKRKEIKKNRKKNVKQKLYEKYNDNVGIIVIIRFCELYCRYRFKDFEKNIQFIVLYFKKNKKFKKGY